MDYYTGPGGNDAWDGTSWLTRKATIQAMINIGQSAGNRLIVGPGVYREQVNIFRGGLSITKRGCLSVTEGSKIVTGTDTNWVPAVQPGDQLTIPWLAYGGDGPPGCDLDGAGGLTTGPPGPAGNDAEFQDNIVGFCVNVKDRGSYLIAALVGLEPTGAITLTDINNIGWAAATDISFWVPSNEGSYEIESVDSDTQITLRRPWSGPTYTWTHDRYKGGSGTYGDNYEIWRPVYLIGDETGELTDGVGGVCRITGSDDDLVRSARTRCIYSDDQSFWVIRGFQVDSANGHNIQLEAGPDASRLYTFEDIRSIGPGEQHIYLLHSCESITVRRCAFFGGNFDLDTFDLSHSFAVKVREGTMRWGYALHVENCLFECDYGVGVENYGNITMKSCTSGMQSEFGVWTTSIDLGGCVFVHDCEWHYSTNNALWAAGGAHEIVANWNNFWDNNSIAANWTWGVGNEPGPQDTEFCYIPEMPHLVDDYRYPVRLYPPSQWWVPAQHTGLYPANEDIYGVPRATLKTKRSLGCYQDDTIERDTVTVYAGEEASLMHPDARRTQFRTPISGDPVTVSVFVQYEANYVGNLPKLVVWQPGQAEVEIAATGAADAWEQLSVYFVPNATPRYIWAELVSDNTAAPGANIAVYWQRLSIIPEIG